MRTMVESDFSRDEYVLRCENMRELMRAKNIDTLLVTQSENIGYFSGFRLPTFSKKTLFFILPLEGDPRIVLPMLHLNDAETTSWVEDIRTYEEPEFLGAPSDPVQLTSQIFTELGAEKGRIGMELGNNMRVEATQQQIDSLRARLGGAKLVNASDLIWQLRQIKSPAEVRCIRVACDITVKAVEEGLRSVKPGISERELQRIVYMKMLELGAEDIPLRLYMHVMARTDAAGDPRCRHKRLERGDLVIFDGGACEKGYLSDITRVACIGTPTARQRQMYEAGMKANSRAISEVLPGQTVQRVYEAAMTVVREAGFYEGKLFVLVGHGIGLEIHEPPYLEPDYGHFTIKPGMVLAVETWLYDEPILRGAPGEGQIGVEDDFLVTESGRELLTPLENDIWVV